MDEDVLAGLKLFESNFRLRSKIISLMDEWRRAYPSVDIKSQISWAHSWLISNPKKMKSDLVRFLNNWMKGEEKRNMERRQGERRTFVPLPPPQRYNVPEEDIMTAEDFQKMREAIRKPHAE